LSPLEAKATESDQKTKPASPDATVVKQFREIPL
jgi:hypothetical protein